MTFLRLVGSALVFVTVLLGVGVPFGKYPALLPLLNPLSGVWQNTPQKKVRELSFQGLKERVDIYWDDRDIPHVFAQNLEDLYFAQGYVTAFDRLFQMDISTRAGLGRLSEWIRPAVKKDLQIVGAGLREAARKKFKKMMAEPGVRRILQSYVDGINTYIEQGHIPLEYKLLGMRPEKWELMRPLGLINSMGWMLTSYSRDLEITQLAKNHGFDTIKRLFPYSTKNSLPIIREFSHLKKKKRSLQDGFISQFSGTNWRDIKPYQRNGSNSWAIHPQHTQNSKTLLANDTHLSYILPSYWYEIQLHAPGLNVYGGSFPGLPGVIIGFNNKVAWGLTNASADVMDWYEVEFKDKKSLQYKHDGVWKKARVIKEKVLIHGRPPLEIKQVWTHQGVVYKRQGSLALVLKTVLHEASNEIGSLMELNRSKNFKQCQQSMTQFYAPALNIICVDAQNIGIWHQGLFPDKWWGQGRYILDGRRADHDWTGWLSPSKIPFEINPKRGYVHSANQIPLPKRFNIYLGKEYVDSYRARRIEEQLKQIKTHDPQKMIALQNDTKDVFTLEVKPLMLRYVHTDLLQSPQVEFLDNLKKWEGDYSLGQVTSTFFYIWYQKLSTMIFSDQLTLIPSRASFFDVLTSASSHDSWGKKWVDHVDTEEVESLREVVSQSFLATWRELSQKFGPSPSQWLWEKFRKVTIKHSLGRAFSEQLSTPGVETAIRSNKGHHGPSWKMVVEMGKKEVRAWVNYPGGPSGNPFDPNYTLFLESWAKGKMREVNFYQSRPLEKRGFQTLYPRK